MTRWPLSLEARIRRLQRQSAANQRQALQRVRAFAMRRGLAGWDPYPLRRKR